MRRALLLGVALLLAAAGPAAGQAPRVDPLLRALARPDRRQAVALAPRPGPGAPRRQLPLGGVVALDRGPAGEDRVGVLVRLRDAGGLAALRAAGAEIGSVAHGIATARVPLAGLAAVMAAPGLAAIEAAQVVEAVHDTSMRAIGVDGLRTWTGSDWDGWAGHGVIVGIYDSGLDYRHGDFRDAAGRTRVIGLWDQTTTDPSRPPPAGFTYGQYCAPGTLEDESCTQRDLNGHGTHVAGTAAGNGLAVGDGGTAARYAGVAPAADLLVVKGGDGGFSFDRILDGIRWIFEEAERLGRPVVANLSLGGLAGPHDGTTLFEQALDQLVGPGRIIVVSAGNDGSNGNTTPSTPAAYLHGMAVPAAGETRDFVVELGSYAADGGACNDRFVVELWHEPDDRLEVTVVRPDGTSLGAVHGQVRVHDAGNGQIYIDNATGGPNPENQDYQVWIQVADCGAGGPPAAGPWTLRVRATAAASGQAYHLWIADATIPAHGAAGFDNGYIVANPGTARRTVTVGAFVTRHCWPTAGNSSACNGAREALGDIAAFSSGGPTRDGRLKPEIAAPGRSVVSARSRDGTFIAFRTTPDGVHWALDGTSMAAPHVTGAVALMLQRQRTLAPEDVKAIFSRTAARDAFTAQSYTGEPAGEPNNQWGYGKLDVRRALEELPAPATLAVEVEPAGTGGVAPSARGERIPLLRLRLAAIGDEGIELRALGFELRGEDPGARALLLADEDADGAPDPDEPVVAQEDVMLLAGAPTTVVLETDGVQLPPEQSAALLLLLELSGGVPNGAAFEATFRPGDTRSEGLRSGWQGPLDQPAAVASGPARTTLLGAGEVFALSENPVRSGRVVFNFAARPRIAGVYTLDGRRVADLLARMDSDGRVEWDLRNDEGGRVAAGVYLVVFDVAGRLVREKLFVLRPAGAP